MWAFRLTLLAGVLTRLIVLGRTTPINDVYSYITSRSQFCANAPLTVAGTYLDRRTLAPDSVDATKDDSFISPKAPRGNSQSTVQCAPSSRTYLVVTPTYLIASSSVVQVLTACYSAVASHILQDGDGVIEGGAFSWQGNNGITLSTMNTNNHQNTWGVIGAAIIALQDFMQENGYGGATFSIWDGPNMVGRGWLGWE